MRNPKPPDICYVDRETWTCLIIIFGISCETRSRLIFLFAISSVQWNRPPMPVSCWKERIFFRAAAHSRLSTPTSARFVVCDARVWHNLLHFEFYYWHVNILKRSCDRLRLKCSNICIPSEYKCACLVLAQVSITKNGPRGRDFTRPDVPTAASTVIAEYASALIIFLQAVFYQIVIVCQPWGVFNHA